MNEKNFQSPYLLFLAVFPIKFPEDINVEQEKNVQYGKHEINFITHGEEVFWALNLWKESKSRRIQEANLHVLNQTFFH